MAWFDMPEPELVRHRTATAEPSDLEAFWQARIAEARTTATPTTLTPYGSDVSASLPVWDVEFSGARGDRIKGWYVRPARSANDEPLPVVVQFVGFGGGRGLPVEHSLLASGGYAHLVVDVRGRGGNWNTGATRDPGGSGGPLYPSVMTRGISDPLDHDVTWVYVDAVRAVDIAAELPGVDPSRMGVRGGSQGVALAIAAAALTERDLRVCQADVPFRCDIRRDVTITYAFPYGEIAKPLAEHVDLVPTAAKEIAVYPFGVHSVASAHLERQLRHRHEHLAPVS